VTPSSPTPSRLAYFSFVPGRLRLGDLGISRLRIRTFEGRKVSSVVQVVSGRNGKAARMLWTGVVEDG